MELKSAIHCLTFDDRAIAVAFEPDGVGFEAHAYTVHVQALAGAAHQLVRVALELAERKSDSSGDPEAGQKIHGVLVGAEVLTSMVRALAFDMEEHARPVPVKAGKVKP